MDRKKNALMIFMKYPVRGKVKTRLAKDIGDESALRIYKSLVENTINGIKNTRTFSYDIVIYLDDEIYIEKASSWLNIPKENFFTQSGSDLGEKLTNAFAVQLLRYQKVIVIGTDIPGISSKVIEDSLILLELNDVVIGPAFDGGYYLLGSRILYPEIFSEIEWSTSIVLRQTLEKITKANLEYGLLEKKRDIDTLEDLKSENFSGNSGV